MTIDKKLYLQLREVALATCNNAYLMGNGEVITNTQYKQLDFWGRLQTIMYYKYSENIIIKI